MIAPARWLLRAGLSLGLLAGLLWAVDPEQLLQRLWHIDLGWFAWAVCLGLCASCVSAWRWHRIALALGLHAPFRALLLAYGRGVCLNAVLPGATLSGDAYRSLAVQRMDNPWLGALNSVVLDRLTGLWTLALLSGMAWLLLGLGRADLPQGVLAAHLLGLGLALVLPFALRLGRSVAAQRVQRVSAQPSAPPRAGRMQNWLEWFGVLAWRTLPASLLVQGLTVLALGSAWLAVGNEVSLLLLLALAAPVFVATALPISVGGFGPREASLALYAAMLGLSVEGAVAAGLVFGLTVTLQGALWSPAWLLQQRT